MTNRYQTKNKIIKKFTVFALSIFFLVGLLFVAGVANRPVVFHDSELENVVRSKVNKPSGIIYHTDVSSITELDASNRGIMSLDGLEFFSKLTHLNLENNKVNDLSPLTDLRMLKTINLNRNSIESMEDIHFEKLKSLWKLEELRLRDNQISDISSFHKLRNLEVLDLRDNFIDDISSIAHLSELKILNLQSNYEIASLYPLIHLTNLETLVLRNVFVGKDTYIFENMTSLYNLNIRNCGIEDMSFLSSLMEKGALQDNHDIPQNATLNILENKGLQYGFDTYATIRPYWKNIGHRSPINLPHTHGVVNAPSFSHVSGFYSQNFFLELTLENSAGNHLEIFYTLDGSEPDPANLEGQLYHIKQSYPSGETQPRTIQTYRYEGPIFIYDRSGEENALATVNTMSTESPFEPGKPIHKGTTIRAIAYENEESQSPIVTQTFFIHPERHALFSLPVLSIVTSPDNLFDYEKGIYVAGKPYDDWIDNNPESSMYLWNIPANYHLRGIDWEKPSHVELFKEGKLLYTQNIGLRISGGSTRIFRMKSLRLYARGEYDLNKRIHYPFFNEIHPVEKSNYLDSFDTLNLRNAGNDFEFTLIRDPLMHRLVNHLSFDTQAYSPVIHFINGEYWGIINVRERLDLSYIESHYGVDQKDIAILIGDAIVDEGKSIDSKHFIEVRNYLKNNDMTTPEAYAHVQKYIDTTNFLEYHMCNIYFNNGDWPSNNIKYWRKRTDETVSQAPPGHDGRWRWMMFDTDYGFGLNGDYTDNTMKLATDPGWGDISIILRKLLENEDFKNQFINTFADNLNTSFHPQRVTSVIQEMIARIEPDLLNHQHRWGIGGTGYDVLYDFASHRPLYMRQHLIDYFDMDGTAHLTVRTDLTQGYVRINSIEIKSSTPGVQEVFQYEGAGNWTGIYFRNIPLIIEALPYPGYRFSHWEGIESTDNIITKKLIDDLVIKAVFEPID